MSSSWIYHSGFVSGYDSIPRSEFAQTIDETDYPVAYSVGESFVASLSAPILITFEADNGWLDVNGSYSGGFAADDHQYIAGLFSPYSSFSPAATGANGRTTMVPGVAAGDHANGTASGTIEYIHADGGLFSGNRIHFNLDNIGHAAGPDEPDLARVNLHSNIDRGINITTGVDAVVGGSYDQFLEVLPSEQNEGGLNVYFLGTEAATGDPFSNPVTAFGFYLMGREIKRDVYLDVYDTSGALIHSAPTVEPASGAEAMVEYVAFSLGSSAAHPVGAFELREEYNSEPRSERDIFSIDNLVVQFSDADDGFSDIDGDGFVDQIVNYQMWSESGGVDLQTRGGRTLSDDSSPQWDAIKAIEDSAGFSVLLEGERRRNGQYRVITADDSGVIDAVSPWMRERQMVRRGYEEVFEVDFNGNGVIDFI